ncbi:MAG: CDP-alcohol phosphatidyltransferase family protein [Candidatus Eisenbacteria bacterium]|nr:CDP-alcohol phosphatidyltransferase family protein [Candidatus Eisenbacteria bacterium]
MKRHIPNGLSLLRILLAAPVVLAIRDGRDLLALALLAAAFLTDGLDGWAARRWNASSEAGRVLDPLADKALAAAVAVSLWLWRGLPFWFLAAVLARDLLILAGGALVIRRAGRVPASRLPGKVAFNALAAVLFLWILPLHAARPYALAAGTAALVLSFLLYLRVFLAIRAGRERT